MQSSRGLLRLQRPAGWGKVLCIPQCRKASLTSAIERGIRNGKRGLESAERRRFERPFETPRRHDDRFERGEERTQIRREYTKSGPSDYFQKERKLDIRSPTNPWQTGNKYRDDPRKHRSEDHDGSWNRHRNAASRGFFQDSQASVTIPRE